MGSVATLAVIITLSVLSDEQPTSGVLDRVDLVEINHFCDERGRTIFHQLIFYDWCAATERYQVRAWKPLRKDYQYPTKNWRRSCYTAVWYDKGVKRIVEAKVLRESWTQYDPELVEREYLAPENRTGLLNQPGPRLRTR